MATDWAAIVHANANVVNARIEDFIFDVSLERIRLAPYYWDWSFRALRELIFAKDNPTSLIQSARTAVAAVVSLLAARTFRLPEPYWAAITTLIVMQSSLGAALPVSAQRFAGTAVGAALGAAIATWFPGNAAGFGIGVLALGMLGAAVRADRGAYRYAGITLAIVLLFPRPANPWVVAVHRFCEVSIGIAIGLAITWIWPERRKDAGG